MLGAGKIVLHVDNQMVPRADMKRLGPSLPSGVVKQLKGAALRVLRGVVCEVNRQGAVAAEKRPAEL